MPGSFFSKKRSLLFAGSVLFSLLILSISGIFGGRAVLAVGASGSGQNVHIGKDAGREVLPKNDGWAAADGGTTGGSTADSAHVYIVTNREQLVQALGGTDATPKIIYIKGVINGNEDDAGNPLTCDDYATDGYSLDAYLQTYDPAVWGRTQVPSGPLEDARKASAARQGARVKISIPSNTTIVGSDDGARVLGANFVINNANNVIIRNIQFEDAFDCFPQWDPTDGATGNWNSAYDNLSITGSTHIWIDHNSFTDAGRPDNSLPQFFGRVFEQHDGEIDPTKAADLITISWNRFANHNKTMLIGSSDSATTDAGKLRITIHHNSFENVSQRLPRVRFGQVHVYNNYYNEAANPSLLYALGVGISSHIFEQNNYYVLPTGFTPDKIISVLKGTAIHTEGDLVNGEPVDLLAAYNAANDPDLSGDVGWVPQLHGPVNDAVSVPDLVRKHAGAGHIVSV